VKPDQSSPDQLRIKGIFELPDFWNLGAFALKNFFYGGRNRTRNKKLTDWT